MKVLMITPRVDMEHDVFGFIHSWVDELSKRVERLDVITFKVGKTDLRENVNLYSAYSKYQPIKFLKLNRFLLSLTPKVDVVFTHMYPWLPIAAAPYAKVFRKPLIMFNAHGHVDFKKKLAANLVDRVVTSSERGFNIDTPKKNIIGQGIDTKKFKPDERKVGGDFEILSVGRIDKIKGYDILIRAVDILVNKKHKDIRLKILGPVYDDGYYQELIHLIKKYKLEEKVVFLGAIPFSKVEKIYKDAYIYASASTTGSLDKTTLEAMSCSLPVIVCNEAFLEIFDEEMKEKCYFEKENYRELAEKIEYFMENEEKELRKRLREIIVKNHSVENLVENLVRIFESVRR